MSSQESQFPGTGALRQTGKLFALAASVLWLTFKRPFQVRELIEQFWFIASVTILPSMLVSIPFGAVITLQVGSLTQQLGAESFTGAASVLAVVQQASPLIVALLIAGAGGSAICADIGARTIREEMDAMEVMGVSPIHRLIVPARAGRLRRRGAAERPGFGRRRARRLLLLRLPCSTARRARSWPASPPSRSCLTCISARSKR